MKYLPDLTSYIMKRSSFTFPFAVFLIFVSSCNHRPKQTYTEWSGDYIEEPAYPAKPAHLRIRQVDHSLFFIQLDSAKTGGVENDCLLSGEFNLPMKGQFPFNFKLIDHRTGILRIKNKAIVFRKA
jgi:hypothetical protein